MEKKEKSELEKSQEQDQMKSRKGGKREGPLEATFSTLILSIASSATISMGLTPHPSTNKIEKNFEMAHFNIDLLTLLEKKTKNNLLPEEEKFLHSIINDLKMKFVQAEQTKTT